jgi:DNA polymerase III alpha subunit
MFDLAQLKFENYHIHSCESNVFVADSAVTKADYAKRVKELGHTILSSCEHGYQGKYFDTYDIAKEHGLKFIFGCEAYWVKDRHVNDRSNGHICLFAKSEKGRKAINNALSEANISGFYYRPRLDLELILALPPDDVFVTSSCVAFWMKSEKFDIIPEETEVEEDFDAPVQEKQPVSGKRFVYKYDDIEDIVDRLHNHFGDNFMLEVQYHHTELQTLLNKKIATIALNKNIKMIMGCDSHFIFPHQADEREIVLEAKKIFYEEEVGWFMDYPDGATAFRRFKEQGIFTDEQIVEFMENTHVFRDFEDIEFNKDIKLPELYPNLSQKERNSLYKKIIMEEWNKFKSEVPVELHEHYKKEIRDEVKCIVNTGMADYFLLDYEIVKDALANGGIITNSGRGSAVSYFTNMLLGFTKVDRVSAPVRLYPERFISETRILESNSLPDLDMNLGNPDIFIQSQKRILGEDHAYPMIAFGTFKKASAFKIYARAKKLSATLQNEITSQIEEYDKAVKYADDDDKDLIDLLDYVDEQYHSYISESEKYYGIISDRKQHPCAHLLYAGSIREDIGLILCKSESTGKEVLTTVMDGNVAEKFKYLKNDLLKVDVVLLIDKIYQRANVKPHTVNQLLKIIAKDKLVWKIYENGLTMGINQVEKYSTTKKVMKFKPSNISELTAFVAAIRPSFKSMYNIFESRVPFSYEIPSFDRILQTEEVPNSYVLYQEQMMATLAYAGFHRDETYSIIKAIAKKKPAIVKPLKDRFVAGFSEVIMRDDGVSEADAIEMSGKVWQIIDDSAGYGFNASHAYCVALDSVYGAYLKAHYPYEFYESMLRHYATKNKDKVALFKQEMKVGFGIKAGDIKFGKDNRDFVANPDDNEITQSIQGIKYMNDQVGDTLYELGKKKPESFIDILYELQDRPVNSRQLDILVKLNYFSEYGRNQKLLTMIEYFNKYGNAKSIKKENVAKLGLSFDYFEDICDETEKTYKNIDNRELLERLWHNIEDKGMLLVDQVNFELDHLEYVSTILEELKQDYAVVVEMEFSSYDKAKSKPFLTCHNLRTGEKSRVRIVDEKTYAYQKVNKGDVIWLRKVREEPKKIIVDGKRVKSETDFNYFLDDWINVATKNAKATKGKSKNG